MKLHLQQRISDIHPELFHYTDNAGLLGILKSQYLRATHWQHLNDTQEIIYFRKKLISLIKPNLLRYGKRRQLENQDFSTWLEEKGGIDNFVNATACEITTLIYKTLLNNDGHNSLLDFFIVSFSTPEGEYHEVREHGLLSQWRAYSGATGYAIVFDTVGLEKLMETESSLWTGRYTLGDVGYSSDALEVLYRRLDAISQLKTTVIDFVAHNSQETATNLLTPFLDCCTHFKNWAFSEEHEVRLVATHNGPKMHKQNKVDGISSTERPPTYYNKNGKRTPYLNIFEGIQTAETSRLPIRRIIVGPGINQIEQAIKLKDFLKQHKNSIEVNISEIPLRA